MSDPDYSDLKQPWLLGGVCEVLAWSMMPVVVVLKVLGQRKGQI